MNPVVGLDVAKGESQVQAFLDKKKPYKSSFKVTHTPVVQYFKDRGYLLIIVNPLISYRAKSSSLRKVKTDVIDAYHLCELYYKEELEPFKKRGIQLLNLRNLTRQHENITGIYVQTKLQFQAVLDQVFREYRGVFGDLYSVVSLLTLLEYPTSEDILDTGEESLIVEFLLQVTCHVSSINNDCPFMAANSLRKAPVCLSVILHNQHHCIDEINYAYQKNFI